MKKLLAIAIGIEVLPSGTISFAQDTTSTDSKKMQKKEEGDKTDTTSTDKK